MFSYSLSIVENVHFERQEVVMGSAGACQYSCGVAVDIGGRMSTVCSDWMNWHLPHSPVSDSSGQPRAAPISGEDLQRIARAAGNSIIIYLTA